MLTLAPEITTLLQRRQGILTHVMLWLSARNRNTGATETIGLWTGPDHQQIVVGGQSRLYYGAGNVLNVPSMTSRAGLEVREHEVTLSALSPEVITALRVYDPRLGRVEIHEMYCDPTSELPVADPVRTFKGWVLEAPISTPEDGGDATATIRIASSAWSLTRGLPLTRSGAALEARAPGDKFRAYTDLSGAVNTVWGAEQAKGD